MTTSRLSVARTGLIPSVDDGRLGADLFICDTYFFDNKVRYHLDWATPRDKRAELRCGRITLTHMSAAMLNRLGDLPADLLVGEDGAVITD